MTDFTEWLKDTHLQDIAERRAYRIHAAWAAVPALIVGMTVGVLIGVTL